MHDRADLLQGSLDLLILKIVALQPLHGWGISKRIRQLTDADPWDVRWPSDDGERRIVYELGGELQVLDLATGASRAVAIEVPSGCSRPARCAEEDRVWRPRWRFRLGRCGDEETS